MSLPTAREADTSFRGWRVLAWSTIALVLTAPGQTIGVSSFTDHMIADLGVDRSTLSLAYLIGTLIAATTMPAVGRWVDRRGVRHTMTWVGVAFAAAIAFTGMAQNIVMAGAAFVGLRMMGQGSLSLIGQTSISLWFEKRRGRAFAIATTVSTGLMSLTPLVFTALIAAVGWRLACWYTAAFIALTLIPIGRFAMIDRPADVGQVPDGLTGVAPEDFVPQKSLTVGQALRTSAFWSMTTIGALASALSTGLTFHNVSVMGEGGLTETQAAAVFLPITVGAVVSSFVVGWLTDRVRAQVLVPFAAAAFAVAAVAATAVSPGFSAVVYGLAIGVASGAVRALSTALFPKWYGTDHIGAIRGIGHTVGVAASAVGPLILSIGNDVGNSYDPVLIGFAVVAVVIAVVTAFVKDPVG